jgi:hypothetical protein
MVTQTIFSSPTARHRQQSRKDLYFARLHADILEKVVAKDFGDPLARNPAVLWTTELKFSLPRKGRWPTS